MTQSLAQLNSSGISEGDTASRSERAVAIRRVLQEMAEAGELELESLELAAAKLALALSGIESGSALGEWLCGSGNGIAELYADDAQLHVRLGQMLAH